MRAIPGVIALCALVVGAAAIPSEDEPESANLTGQPLSDPSWAPPISEHRISTPYGKPGEMWRWKGYHTGDDYAAAEGTPITAAGAGRVVAAGWLGDAYGNGVIIRHSGSITTMYAHMSSVWADSGATVELGQPIGRVGATGNTTGPHLHFEVRRDDEPIRPFAATRGGKTAARRGEGYRPMMLR